MFSQNLNNLGKQVRYFFFPILRQALPDFFREIRHFKVIPQYCTALSILRIWCVDIINWSNLRDFNMA